MISLINPEEQFELTTISHELQKAHAQFTEARLMEALIARFGELPPEEEIIAHCMCVIDADNVSHYCWFDVKPKVGEKVDLSNPLCSIAPPKIYTTNPEHQ